MNNREYQSEYQQQYETIEIAERIFSLLKPALGCNTSIKVAPYHSDELFQSNLLNIDYQRKRLSLRKIDYTFGHLMVIDAKSLRIYLQYDGTEVFFTTHLSRYCERNGGYYEVHFPATVNYCQRGMSHQIYPDCSLNIRA